MKINLGIVYSVITIICFIAFFTIVGFAAYEYSQAESKCNHLRSDKNCDYKVCMAKEYNSNTQIERAVNCIFLYEHDALGEKDE